MNSDCLVQLSNSRYSIQLVAVAAICWSTTSFGAGWEKSTLKALNSPFGGRVACVQRVD
jgi:hypothetical protein